MSIYEEFINFLQKEYKLPKPLKGQKIVRPEKIIDVPKPMKWPKAGEDWASASGGGPSVKKGGQGSGRKAGSGSKLSAPKRGSPIKTAITRYEKNPTPSLHQKIVEAFRGKEGKKQKPDTTEAALASLKHPLD